MLSVVIPVFNNEDLLDHQLAAVLGQDVGQGQPVGAAGQSRVRGRVSVRHAPGGSPVTRARSSCLRTLPVALRGRLSTKVH